MRTYIRSAVEKSILEDLLPSLPEEMHEAVRAWAERFLGPMEDANTIVAAREARRIAREERWANAERWARDYGGSAKDIAAKLGITPGAVRGQLGRKGIKLERESHTPPFLWT